MCTVFDEVITSLKNVFELSIDINHHFDLKSESNWNIMKVSEVR